MMSASSAASRCRLGLPRFLPVVLCLLALSVFALSPAFADQRRYYWIDGYKGTGEWFDEGFWSSPHTGWTQVWRDCSMGEHGSICVDVYGAKPWSNGNNALFGRYNAVVYPKKYNVYVNTGNGGWPGVYEFIIDNSKNGGNYTFQPATGIGVARIMGNDTVPVLKTSPAIVDISGSTSANRYTATFDNVDLLNFKKFTVRDYDSVVFKGSALNLDNGVIYIKDHAVFSWDGADNSKGATPLLHANAILGEGNSVLNLSLPDFSSPVSIPGGILGSKQSFSVHLWGGSGFSQIVPDIINASVFVEAGRVSFSDRQPVTGLALSIAAGAELFTTGGMYLDKLHVDGKLIAGKILSTPSLSGSGTVRVANNQYPLRLNADARYRHPSFTFTGDFDLCGSILSVDSYTTLGQPGRIYSTLPGGLLTANSPVASRLGAVLGNGNDSLTLDLSGQPLTLALSANTVSSGAALYKTGNAGLILDGGRYDFHSIHVQGGSLTLTGGVTLGLPRATTLNVSFPGSLRIAGHTNLTGALNVQGSSLTLDGVLTLAGDAKVRSSLFDYRGGLLSVTGELNFAGSDFSAQLPHPGVFVVAEYGSLISRFSNAPLDSQNVSSLVRIHGVQSPAMMSYTPDNRILLAASDVYSLLYRTGAAGDRWRSGQIWPAGQFWQDLNGQSQAWDNHLSHVAVFGGLGITPYQVQVEGTVHANMLSFLDGGWSIGTGGGLNDQLTLQPFVDNPASPYYFAVLNSQTSPALPPAAAPRLDIPVFVSNPAVPLWKTGGGDLVLAGTTAIPPAHGASPLQILIKDGRLILEHENALGGNLAGQQISIDQGAALALNFPLSSSLYGSISGAGSLEAWADAALTKASPDFTGPVQVKDDTTLILQDRQAAGNAPGGEAIQIGVDATVKLDYTDDANALPRVLSGKGGVEVTDGNKIRLAAGNSYEGGTLVGNNSSLTMEGPGLGKAFTAAGSGEIVLGASGELKLLSGGILRNELVGGAALSLDAHVYRLEDNNIRVDGKEFTGEITISKGGALTLGADSAKGVSVTPPFSLTGTGGLILHGPNVTFSGLKTGDFEGRTIIENYTTLQLASNNYGKDAVTPITLLGADSRLLLDMAGTDFKNPLSGTGTVKLGSGAYGLTGNNMLFSGVIEVSSNTLNVAAQSDVGDARLDLGGGRLDFANNSLALDNNIWLYSGGGTLNNGQDILLRGHILDGDSAHGNLTKTGNGILTLTHPDSDYAGQTHVTAGTLRLEGGGLTGGGMVEVQNGAILSGYGSIMGQTIVNSGGTLSADGHLLFGDTLTLSSTSNLIFNHGGWLDVSGNQFLAMGSIATTINLDSLGVHVLARYDNTNLGDGAVLSGYTVNYGGSDITGNPDYRLFLENYASQHEILLVALPTGQKVEFWNSGSNGVWNTDDARNWNSQYDDAGLQETWASDSRIAVFGSSSVIPGAVKVQGTVAASGLFFLKSGYTVTGGTISLLDLDPLDAGRSYAVISGQEGDVYINATLTDGAPGVGLHKSGAATVTLNAANNYTGDTLVSAGTLVLGNIYAAGRHPAVVVEEGAALRLAYNNSATGLPQTVTGAGRLEISGNVLLDKVNTHSGGTSIVVGELHLAHADALGTGTLFFRNGLLFLANGLDVGNEVDLEGVVNLASIAGGQAATLSGVISGSSLGKVGAGTLILAGDNAFTGNLRLDQGKLVAASDTALGLGTVRMADGAILGFTGARTLQNDFSLNGAALFEATSTGYATLDGIIYGSGDLAKIGDGILTLSGANTYTGMTDVREGALALAAGSRISDRLTLRDGAAFITGGNDVRLAELHAHWRASYTGDLHTGGGMMQFHLPASVRPGNAAILSVDGKAEIGGSWVALDLGGRNRMDLRPDHVLHLMETSGGLTGIPANNVVKRRLGITRAYRASLWTDSYNLYAGVTHVGASQESKALSEGFLAGLALVNQGADLAAGNGMSEAVSASRRAAREETERGYALAVFGTISGGWSRYNTGSHIDMSSVSIMTGLSVGIGGVDAASDLLTIGGFFEYGNGSYDTYNSFSQAASVSADGNAYYIGGGILGRMEFAEGGTGSAGNAAAATRSEPGTTLSGEAGASGAQDVPPSVIYAETSFRAGSLHNGYNSSDLRDEFGRRAEYDSSSAYHGFHVGTGYIWNVNDKASLDFYGKYFWTRLEGDSVTLPNGDPVKFKDADSHRLRFGGRFTHAVNDSAAIYIGSAWEHEFSARARATTYGYDIDRPTLSGSTGIGELGLALKPAQTLPLFFDLGVQGYVGKREGVTGSLQVRWEF